jgi:hypothetical protein
VLPRGDNILKIKVFTFLTLCFLVFDSIQQLKTSDQYCRPPPEISRPRQPSSQRRAWQAIKLRQLPWRSLLSPLLGARASNPVIKSRRKKPKEGTTCRCPRTRTRWSHIPITFSQDDLCLKDYPHRNAMVISCVIKGFVVHNVLVDTGSDVDIIFVKAFRQM